MAREELTATTSQSKSQRAYHWIKGRIANQDFTPGYRLVLGSIAKELDMSVVPVREAIRQLEADAEISTAAEIDAALLTDDLPPTAYSDAGFAEFLKTPRD